MLKISMSNVPGLQLQQQNIYHGQIKHIPGVMYGDQW